MVLRAGLRGVVVELYASGTGPSDGGDTDLPGFVERCRLAGVCVAAVAEAPAGSVNSYESAISVRRAGAFFRWPLLPEVAVVKLMWALAQSDDPAIVAAYLEHDVTGELS